MIGIGHAEQFLNNSEFASWPFRRWWDDLISQAYFVKMGCSDMKYAKSIHKFCCDLHCIPGLNIGIGSSNTNELSFFFTSQRSHDPYLGCGFTDVDVFFPFCWAYLGKIPNYQEYDSNRWEKKAKDIPSNIAPENRLLQKEIPIGNHNSGGLC